MKKQHKIDELFHEKLREASIQDKTSASSWDNISSGLDKQAAKGFLSGGTSLVTVISSSITILLIATSLLYFTTRHESTNHSRNSTSSNINTPIASNSTSSNINTTIANNSTSTNQNTPLASNSTSSNINTTLASNSTSTNQNTPLASNSTSSNINTTLASNSTSSNINAPLASNSTSSNINAPLASNSTSSNINTPLASNSTPTSHFNISTTLPSNTLFQSSTYMQMNPHFESSRGIFSSGPAIHTLNFITENQVAASFPEKQSITSIISELSLASPYLNYFVPGKSIERSSNSFETQGFKHHHRMLWDVSAFASVQTNTSRYSTKNSENISLAEARTQSIEEMSDRTAGVRLSTQYRRFLLETGFSFAELKQTESYSLNSFQIDNYWQEVYGTHPVSYFDTSWYYQYVYGDTVWIPAVQNYIVQVPDTSLISVSDTTKIQLDTSFLNTYSHFEVPFLAGYLLGQGTFEVFLKAGVIGKYYTGIKGYSTLGPWVKDIYALDIEKISRFGVDSYVGAEFRYHPGYRFYIFGDIYYRRSLLSPADSYGFIRTEEKYGLKFGLGYYL